LIGGRADPLDIKFAQDAMGAINKIFAMLIDPTSRQNPGERYKSFEKDMDAVGARSRDLINHFLKARESGQFGKLDYPDPYMERLMNRKEMNLREITDSLVNFLFAGVDTTSGVLLWLILNLAQNPKKQEILRQEVLSVMGQESALQPDHLRQLPYLSACIRESHVLLLLFIL